MSGSRTERKDVDFHNPFCFERGKKELQNLVERIKFPYSDYV